MNRAKVKYYSLWTLTICFAIIALRDLFPAYLQKIDWLTLISTVGAIASFAYQVQQSSKGAAKDEFKELETRLRQEDAEIRQEVTRLVNTIKSSNNDDIVSIRNLLNELILKQRFHEKEPGHKVLLEQTINIHQKVLVLEAKAEVLTMLFNTVLGIRVQSIALTESAAEQIGGE